MRYVYVCMKHSPETMEVTGVFKTLKEARDNKPKGDLWAELWRFTVSRKPMKRLRLRWKDGSW